MRLLATYLSNLVLDLILFWITTADSVIKSDIGVVTNSEDGPRALRIGGTHMWILLASRCFCNNLHRPSHARLALDSLRVVVLGDLLVVSPIIESRRLSGDQVKSSSIQADHLSVVTNIIELKSDTSRLMTNSKDVIVQDLVVERSAFRRSVGVL